MKRFGLMPHTEKGHALNIAKAALATLEAGGATVVLEPDAAKAVGRPDLGRDAAQWGPLKAGIVLGGDGALLRAARLVAEGAAAVVVDCETSYIRLDLAQELARQLGAPAVRLAELRADNLTSLVKAQADRGAA